MKGLLLKDFYMIKSYFRSFILIMVVFTGISLFDVKSSFLFFYPMILAGTVPFSLMAYDERSKWESYCATLPVSRKQVVAARYLIAALFVLAVFLINAAVQPLSPVFQVERYLSNLSLLLVVGLLCPSVLLPLCFRFGVEKSRLFYYFIIGIFCASSLLLTDTLGELAERGNKAVILPTGTALALPGIAILLFFLSWLLSVRIYQKREL